MRFGETLFVLAKRLGVELSDILDYNPQITKPDLVLEGAEITLPPSTCHDTTPIGECSLSTQPAWVWSLPWKFIYISAQGQETIYTQGQPYLPKGKTH
jgi:hypothetical protein